MATSAWAQSAQAPTKNAPEQGPPPKKLAVRPDGHVSANQDPANPEKFEVHVVVKGETLSGIAGQAMGNSRLWPQLWEQNEHIINPHWIYPDDKILIKPVTPVTEAKPPEPEPPPAPVVEAPPPPRRPTPPPPQAPPPPPPQETVILVPPKPVSQIKYEDLYCSGIVKTSYLNENLFVISKFDSTGGVLAADGNYVYLSEGSQSGVAVGNVYQVMRSTIHINNPWGRNKAERELGLHYLDVAQLRVVLVQPDFSMARVERTCADAVEVGDFLVPFQQISIAEPPRPRPFSPTMKVTGAAKGTIVTTKDVLVNSGSYFRGSGIVAGVQGDRLSSTRRGIAAEGSIVYVDIGHNQPVKPGDLFIIYREWNSDDMAPYLPEEAEKLRATHTAVGELLILKVGERAATALVTYSTDGIGLGDSVESR
jgi:hypothetical protein